MRRLLPTQSNCTLSLNGGKSKCISSLSNLQIKKDPVKHNPRDGCVPAPAATAGARRSRCSDSAGWNRRCSCASERCSAAPGCSATAGPTSPRCGRRRCCQRPAGSPGGRSPAQGRAGGEGGATGTGLGSSVPPDGIAGSGRTAGSSWLPPRAAAAGRWTLSAPLCGPSGSASSPNPLSRRAYAGAGRRGSRSCGPGRRWRPGRRSACLPLSSGWKCCSYASPEGPSWIRSCSHCGPENQNQKEIQSQVMHNVIGHYPLERNGELKPE